MGEEVWLDVQLEVTSRHWTYAFASPWFRPSLIALVVGMLLPFSLVGNEGQEVRCFVEDSREPVVE